MSPADNPECKWESRWETVIGLEIHAQLSTESKIFSATSTRYGASPNTQASVIDLGMPGVLPVLNADAVEMAVKFGLATHCSIAEESVFARKNYFYPDLPKGYQISQFELPIVYSGHIDIPLDDGSEKRIGITRAHLEEDAGKSVHDGFDEGSGIDLNRAGTPLLEIVSEPDMRSAHEAVTYLRLIHTLVQYLEICDGNMQEGSFRCDANVSVRPRGQTELGTRAELKNLNSFRFIERAIEYEVERQIDLIESGESVVQETRLYDPDRNETRPMRGKEEADDYRYFPDPNLLPVRVDRAQVERIREHMPELPAAKIARLRQAYGLGDHEATLIASSRELAEYFEIAAKICPAATKTVTNWIIGDLLGALNKHNIDIERCPIEPSQLGALVARIDDGTISGKIAKTVFDKMWESGSDPDAIIEAQGLRQVTDGSVIDQLVDEVVNEYPQQAQQYRDGNPKLLGFFVGQIMKRSEGKANPKQVNERLRALLDG